ncbi:hypothetical protein [Variovorax sp. J31P207]|uniref:hypothetical protein n=1 Tax=Variovorax sp. J31P207 TaxID=3053510 RepID=UPI0025784B57|nr:hypothetical protein [Variovorax sp. J31P207]MDM0072460.1 hypothetical protein [Variovorax sp. J31P207]
MKRKFVCALWLEQDRPVLLELPAYGDDSIKYNCPNPPYLLYEYVAGQWRSKSLAEIKIKKIRSDLTHHPLSMRDETKKKIQFNRRADIRLVHLSGGREKGVVHHQI